MLVAPTGAGKTVMFCAILKELDQPAVVIAHRQELVSQAALSLNREQVPHGIIAPKEIQQQIIALEMDTHGRTYYAPNAPIRVAGVDTLIRKEGNERWFDQVATVVQDEGHHLTKNSKWHRAHSMFRNARGLLATAHCIRGDGKGLGRSSDGIVDKLVQGPSGRTLINWGYLCDYRLAIAESDIEAELSEIEEGDGISDVKLRDVVHSSKTLVGDVVAHYLRFAEGKLGLTFAVDIDAATKLANAYMAKGIPTAVVTADTPMFVRGNVMRQFRARQLLQVVSVDCLGEGSDVPAVEVVSLARPTDSFQLFAQQIGRALRIMVSDELNAAWGSFTDAQRLEHIARSAKPKALIIDHVGNISRFYSRHGMPDSAQTYRLDRPPKKARSASSGIPLRVCIECLQPYEAFLDACPYCGAVHVNQGRSGARQVDGVLIELDPMMLSALRGEIAQIDGPFHAPAGLSTGIIRSIHEKHKARQAAQQTLRRALMLWGGWRVSLGESLSEAQRRFFYTYGIDVLTAQTLGAPEATGLEARIRAELQTANIVEVMQ